MPSDSHSGHSRLTCTVHAEWDGWCDQQLLLALILCCVFFSFTWAHSALIIQQRRKQGNSLELVYTVTHTPSTTHVRSEKHIPSVTHTLSVTIPSVTHIPSVTQVFSETHIPLRHKGCLRNVPPVTHIHSLTHPFWHTSNLRHKYLSVYTLSAKLGWLHKPNLNVRERGRCGGCAQKEENSLGYDHIYI